MKVFRSLAGMTVMAVCLLAAACATTPPASSGSSKQGQGADCELTCVQWDNQCDVDARGVTTCRRICLRMGKQCL